MAIYWFAVVLGTSTCSVVAALGANGTGTRPTFEELRSDLEAMRRAHPGLMKLEVPGQSVQGRPVFACVLTDSSAPAEEKEHVLITTTHSGIEKGATVAALELMRWLLSADALARETMRRQVIIVMPACNPDGFVKPSFTNDHGHDAYLDWNADGPVKPAGKPAVGAKLEHGFAIRLRVPYAKSTLTGVWLNGAPVTPATWLARGYRYVEVPIPPERLRTDDLFIVTCRYEPGERRAVGGSK